MATKISESRAKALFLKNNLQPLVSFPGSQKPWKSQCQKCRKTVSPSYSKVKSRGHQCGYCAGTKVDARDATNFIRSKGFTPRAPYPGGNKKWPSRCNSCRHELEIVYSSVKLGFGCKYCTGKEIHPDDAKNSLLRRGYKPLSDYPGASKPWKVECVTCKRVQKIRMHSVNSTKKCVYCAKRKLDLIAVHKRLEELDFQPLEKFKNARKPWKIKCLRCHHIIYPTWSHINRRDRNRGCGYCARVRVDIEVVNKLIRQLGLKPLVKYPGGKVSWKCKCLNCGDIVYPKYSDLSRGQGGCSNCANFGLNYTDRGYLYLITHPSLNSHKIGIANSYKSREFDDRMYKHKKQGWIVYKTQQFSKLRKAYQVEQHVIKWLRVEVGLTIHLSRKQMPQGGWTETVDASEIDLKTIWDKVRELSKVQR